MFAQSEFGSSKRSYHCKHGAAAVVAVVPRHRRGHLRYRSLGSLFILFVIPRKRERSCLSDARLIPLFFRSLRLRANIRSFKSRTHAERDYYHEPRRGVLLYGIGPPPQQRCSIQIPIAKRGVSPCAVLFSLSNSNTAHRGIDRPPKHSGHTLALSLVRIETELPS